MHNLEMISEFQGPYRWLSNFWLVPIPREGFIYPSVEHAYMAAKSDDVGWKKYCAGNVAPGAVKRASRSIQISHSWDDEKLAVMRECVTLKFTTPYLADMLIKTGGAYIQEGNRWGDRYWGVDLRTNPPVGHNHLGRIIMDVRSRLVADKE